MFPQRLSTTVRSVPVCSAPIRGLLVAVCCLCFGMQTEAQENGFDMFKLAPAQLAAFDHVTGDVAALNLQSGTIHVYPREYFAGDAKSARGPWKPAGEDQTVTDICFARAKEKTWIAVSFERGTETWLLNPMTLETDAIVNVGSIRQLSAPTDPDSGRLFYYTSRGTGYVDLFKMKNMGMIEKSKVSGSMGHGFVPSHDGTVLYSRHLACRFSNGSVEEIGRTFERYDDWMITDKRQELASTGHAVLTADLTEIITEFDFLVYNFAQDNSIVAGLAVYREEGTENVDIELCLASLADYEPILRQRIPAIFRKSPPRDHLDLDESDTKGHYSVFVDSQTKRVHVFHSSYIASFDYSKLRVPEKAATMSLESTDFPQEVLIGETLEVEITPAGSQLDYDQRLKGIEFSDGVLKWNVHPRDQGKHRFRLEPPDGSPAKSFVVNANWPHFDCSLSGCRGMSADNESLAIWFDKTLLLLDPQTGDQVWSHDFPLEIEDVVLGPKHAYVQMTERSTRKVIAFTRDGEYTLSPIDTLTASFGSQPLTQLRCVSGITAWTGVAGNTRMPTFKACLDATLAPLEGSERTKITNGHISWQGFEYGPDGTRTLFIEAVDPYRSFAGNGAGLVPALADGFNPIIGFPSLVNNKERWRDDRRGVVLTADETSSNRNKTTKLVIHRLDESRIPKVFQILSSQQSLAQVAANDTHVFYYAEAKIFVLPYAVLESPLRLGQLKIEHRQSTFLAQRSKPTVLDYKISGGKAPYEFRAACWLAGPKPDNIKRKIIQSQDGNVALSFTASELKAAAGGLFQPDQTGRQFNLQGHIGGRENKTLDDVLDVYTKTQTDSFQTAVGAAPTDVPVALPIRIKVVDSEGNEAYLGHYVFYELTSGEIKKIVK